MTRTKEKCPAKRRWIEFGSILVAVVILAGCKGVPIKEEKAARQKVAAEAAVYRPEGKPPALPVLTTNSNLGDFLNYALLNQPQVAAAYYDWLGSVERITVNRSLPDPQLTFQADIQNVLTSLMPGLMMNFPGAGKLRAAARAAAGQSEAKYYTFKSAALASAFAVKNAYYRLYFLEEKIRVTRDNLALLTDLERTAGALNEVGKSTLRDVLRSQMERARVSNDLANLEDSRGPLLAQFKAALGLGPSDPAPPVPAHFETTSLDVTSDQLFETAMQANMRLKAMAADVAGAEANIRLAEKARMPDTSLGFMADAWMSPTLYRPWTTVSLPLWRDKLAAQMAEAQANKRAGEMRLSAEQISLATDFAGRMYLYRESTRNLELLQAQLLPKQRQTLASARSSYLSGQIAFANLVEAGRTLLQLGLDQIEARTQRELTLAELSLIVQGMSPSGSPMNTSAIRGMGGGMGSDNSGGGMGSGAGGMLPGNSAPAPKKDSGGSGSMGGGGGDGGMK